AMVLPSMNSASKAFCASEPAAAIARPTISAPRKGSTTRPRPRLWKTTEISKPAPPKPPSSSANRAPMAPSSANCSQILLEKPVSDVAIRSRWMKSYCSEMKRSSVSASMRRSSVCSKFIVPSLQAQDHLGDDVLLDLVRAAENRQLAIVEIHRGCGGCLFRPHGLLIEAFVQRLFDERLGIRAHGATREREDLLADFGAADLQHGALRPRHT